jgi:S-adenosyl-L-methionine hydrolase (adenosine-forming)
MYPYVTFLTDFGLQDDFVGVCRGVIKRIAPDVQILDISHGVAPQAVTQGALVLARAVPYMPAGVHLAVVDPGVGGDRRAIAIRCDDGRVYVGPDNGLLSLAARRESVDAVRELTNAEYHLARVSRTFHARDIFAPAAAHLACGVAFDALGDEVDPATLVRLELPQADVQTGHVGATVLAVDRFGNLRLNVVQEDVDRAGLEPGDRVELDFAVNSYFATVAGTFTDVSRGDLIVYEDSYGAYSIAISDGNAGELTGAAPGDRVAITIQ